MSIKKALMHYFDKATNGMVSFHPETESACVTDWHSGIMNSLASTTLGTVVSALTTDSVFGKLMSLLLSASGVKYSLGPNGYVKFGSFFGGLIIQWGNILISGSKGVVSLPISCTLFVLCLQHHGSGAQYNGFDKSSMQITSSMSGSEGLMWIAIGA